MKECTACRGALVVYCAAQLHVASYLCFQAKCTRRVVASAKLPTEVGDTGDRSPRPG